MSLLKLAIALNVLALAPVSPEKDAFRLTSLPEHQSLEVIVEGRPLRFYFAPWHDVQESAKGFAASVLAANEGRSLSGSGCDAGDSNQQACIERLLVAALEDRLACGRDYRLPGGAFPVLPAGTKVGCLARAFSMEGGLEEQLAQERLRAGSRREARIQLSAAAGSAASMCASAKATQVTTVNNNQSAYFVCNSYSPRLPPNHVRPLGSRPQYLHRRRCCLRRLKKHWSRSG